MRAAAREMSAAAVRSMSEHGVHSGDLKIQALAGGTIEGAATWSIRRPRDITLVHLALFGPTTAFLKLREFRVLRRGPRAR